MKQILLVSLILLLIVFILPIIAGIPQAYVAPVEEPPPSPEEKASPEPEIIVTATPSPSATPATSTSVSVSVTIGGSPTSLPLSEYLYGVLLGEMPEGFPEEALKAQAVAARTYTLYALAHPTTDGVHPDTALCDNPAHCQAYNKPPYSGKIIRAVDDTDGVLVVYEGEPIMAVYFSASWGRTESALDVWGADVPYLQSVESPGEEDAPRYISEVAAEGVSVTNIERTAAGGVREAAVDGVTMSGASIRARFGLNSTNFELVETSNGVIFRTIGYGHGVGLSQYGARAMALEGKNYREILEHYYSGASVV
ncbi:hypothetical protein FACS1894202_11340 [Clostridia bacterium]|nr:hypothetical protein FACS1894202_11340 [Clostridia bacterium]